jgi:hypothetical protein
VPIPTATLGIPPYSLWLTILEASDDGKSYRRIAEFPAGALPEYTITFAPVTARYFRVTFASTDPASIALAAPGAIETPVYRIQERRIPHTIRVNEFRLYQTAIINRFEEKAGFGATLDYSAVETVADSNVHAIPLSQVIDVTPYLRPDGTLDWHAPPGHWRVLRLGYSLTGKQNSPAATGATGLEVDKLDREAVSRYINAYLGRYIDAAGRTLVGAHGLRALVNDSIESGPQNWTAGLLAEFKARRGYDATRWLPALTGVIVESAVKSDAFLYDFRRTLADLLAENHYGEIARSAHAHGLIHYSEALEWGRPTLGDDMDMRRYADIPMSAMWSFRRGGDPNPGYVADMRGAASVAHVYGRNLVAAESLTSVYSPWAFSPRDLQPMIDYEFVSGVNRPVIHSSVHQPLSDLKPGLSLSIFGQYFNRLDTWAQNAGPWVSYISRSCFLLQQGNYVADVAYFYGEEAPLTGLYSIALPLDVPRAYAYDFVNAEVVLNHLRVLNNGDLMSDGGSRYRVLYLGGSSAHMTLAVLRRMRDLVEGGATLVGQAPVGSPSLGDDVSEYLQIKQQLWPADTAPGVAVSRGKGRVLRMNDVEAALGSMGQMPDFDYSKPEADSEILFLHRRLEDGDLYFVTNRRDREQRVTARFRTIGVQPEFWNAISGEIESASYTFADGATRVPLDLGPLASVFVVFLQHEAGSSRSIARATSTEIAQLDQGWKVQFTAGDGKTRDDDLNSLGAWNESADASIRYFSGTATYSRSIEVDKQTLDDSGALWLDLGVVRELADVVVNGQSMGVLWREPYRVDIRRAVVPGKNKIVIRVTNLWVNRLIGDAQRGAHRTTFTTLPSYLPSAPLRLSGLVGPVALWSQPRVH